MTERKAVVVALVALALAVAPLACGSDEESTGGPSGGSTEAQPKAAEQAKRGTPRPNAESPRSVERALPPEAQVDLAIKGVLASAAPDLACRRYATQGYVEKTFGSRGGCVQSTVPESAADSVKVSKIEVSGEEASATAVPSGGPSDGETIKVELVRQGGIWKVASLRSNAPVGP